MNQSMVTIVAPLDPARLKDVEAAIDALGNPARPDLAARLDQLDDEAGIHFVSLHALPSFTAGKAHLVLEFSADGDQPATITRLASAIGGELADVFRLASDWGSAAIAAYLTSHAITTGFGLGAHPGIGHCGSPGMSVGRIRKERALFFRVGEILATQGGDIGSLARLDAVRAELRMSAPDLLVPAEPAVPFVASDVICAALTAIGAFLTTYAKPVLGLLLVAWLVGIIFTGHDLIQLHSLAHASGHGVMSQGLWLDPATTGHSGLAWLLIKAALGLAWKLFWLFLIAFLVFAVIVYLQLRQQEANDWISSRAPDPATLHAIFERENHEGYAHNHMVSLTERKAGWLRYFTLRLVFFAIATLNGKLYKPGYLGSIGTIHFARWITVPGTRDLVFFSNYGGSWESYLEDFITLAHNGLTGVWSNSVGFPRTENLIGLGATDGERFKRFARQSMLPTRFWYSAYPDLDTDMIRVNAAVRRGLSGAMTEDDAALWLSRFGSTLRPELKLVTTEIQSLLFGGLNFLPFATATFWQLPRDPAQARAWLAEVSKDIAWNDGRRVRDDPRVEAIFQLGLSAAGLTALDLPAAGLATFPPAFVDGMAARARVLGDTGSNASAGWWWQEPADAAVLVYGQTREAHIALHAQLTDLSLKHGAGLIHQVPLRDLPQETGTEPDGQQKPGDPAEPGKAMAKVAARHSGDSKHAPAPFLPEPFGFADGISQPLMMGTYKAERSQAHPLHIVAPGEFILGYPDNRGNLPPGPCLPAIYDPTNLLPIPDPDPSFSDNDANQLRDLGRNGSFLVIRQLEQDVDGFNAYCRQESDALNHRRRLGAPYRVTPEFIGAKLVGRWHNGAPLVRSPYSESHDLTIKYENAFKLGFEDPEAMRCPFGAHIRRANPRDSLDPGSDDQIAISNRHRMIRVGRKYKEEDGQKPGILFMCLNGDIERQFEFVQQTWVNGNVISLSCPTNLYGESDPLLGNDARNSGFTIPTRDGPVKLASLPQFVTMRGGGYFFMPGKRLVQYLAQPQ